MDFSVAQNKSYKYLPRRVKNGVCTFYGEVVKVTKSQETKQGKEVYTIVGYAI